MVWAVIGNSKLSYPAALNRVHIHSITLSRLQLSLVHSLLQHLLV